MPAMVANMAPVFAGKYNVLKRLNKPLDFGLMWKGERVLGENKTIRGFVVGVVAAGCMGVFLSLIIHSKPYDSFLLAGTYGVVTGAAALAADSIKSFFKRRLGIKPGQMWIPFDQIDFVVGTSIVAMFFVAMSVSEIMFAIIFVGLLSFVVSKIGFALRIKKNL